MIMKLIVKIRETVKRDEKKPAKIGKILNVWQIDVFNGCFDSTIVKIDRRMC